jgi:hypothetical protein
MTPGRKRKDGFRSMLLSVQDGGYRDADASSDLLLQKTKL